MKRHRHFTRKRLMEIAKVVDQAGGKGVVRYELLQLLWTQREFDGVGAKATTSILDYLERDYVDNQSEYDDISEYMDELVDEGGLKNVINIVNKVSAVEPRIPRGGLDRFQSQDPRIPRGGLDLFPSQDPRIPRGGLDFTDDGEAKPLLTREVERLEEEKIRALQVKLARGRDLEDEVVQIEIEKEQEEALVRAKALGLKVPRNKTNSVEDPSILVSVEAIKNALGLPLGSNAISRKKGVIETIMAETFVSIPPNGARRAQGVEVMLGELSAILDNPNLIDLIEELEIKLEDDINPLDGEVEFEIADNQRQQVNYENALPIATSVTFRVGTPIEESTLDLLSEIWEQPTYREYLEIKAAGPTI